jgi:hypothetical protein
VLDGSNKHNITMDKLNITRDQNSENAFMNVRFTAGTKHKSKAPHMGRAVSVSNIL